MSLVSCLCRIIRRWLCWERNWLKITSSSSLQWRRICILFIRYSKFYFFMNKSVFFLLPFHSTILSSLRISPRWYPGPRSKSWIRTRRTSSSWSLQPTMWVKGRMSCLCGPQGRRGEDSTRREGSLRTAPDIFEWASSWRGVEASQLIKHTFLWTFDIVEVKLKSLTHLWGQKKICQQPCWQRAKQA